MNDKKDRIKIGSLEIDFGNEKHPELRKTLLTLQVISLVAFLVVAILSAPLGIPAGTVTTIGTAVTAFNVAAILIPLLWADDKEEEKK